VSYDWLIKISIAAMDLLIQVRDTEAQFLMELLKKFDFVKVKQQSEQSPVLENLERSLHQMQDMRGGKLPKPDITELFENE
jgi:plasmid maintenance system antidote protein VapI